MNHQTLPYAHIAPNNYNPNVMTDRVYRAELESIARFGFIDPITVREIESQEALAIIDGEHRWRAFGELRAKWEIGDLAEFHPDLLPLFEANELPVVNLGALPDADAKKLTIILNETRGKANTVDLAALLAEIGAEIGGEALSVGLPYNPDELTKLLESVNYDWEAAANKRQSSEEEDSEREGESKPDELITVTLQLSVAGKAFLDEATAIVSTNGMLPKCEIAGDPARALGQAVETLAGQFLRDQRAV